MSNLQTTQINGNIWKLGKSGNIDFCGNFLKLREKEPKTAAELLSGHEPDKKVMSAKIVNIGIRCTIHNMATQ